ncbi:hypothetical protein [Natronobacterium lacisalsi]|uniref:Uncharacterized protein n=1 Tax=Natronobacterium lacisalsi AJ5 TaxID=358396 RepID=M0LEQ2_NATLA|nr:hypothetical protein [Halobiforma lacisalsi]EMA31578.1 hypothetical protein C445_13887 [Halobiforma lacisalsi AJ5]
MPVDLSEFDHPSWITAAGMGVGYLLILALLTLALFVLPWLAFSAL